ncbi:MAG: diadenylate cyclase CdaA [Solobacterium sp.]|jgi:uncharacterized protein (TIGR00159 family)|nr:diadenylate cyclase CdaA [Solobacterium sp.]MCH4050307.1 diadenylate cyclase CdaA [Solobacterium sp.]MCH4075736.1 diadenylate cyclase CdaA [Solobacterium sp.]MCI1312881.1 diadenylate cyclase CdaA [Solobacterium sp.]MCI1345412.1 diadenylate cyclase CdaA [Solobacterium sp.]
MNVTFTLSTLHTIITSILDLLVVWLILYYVLQLVRTNSRTIQIFKGIILVIIIDALSQLLDLKTVNYFADMFLNWGFLALIIIFQPELRSMLEKIGKSNMFNRMDSLSGNEKEKLVDQVVTAVMLLSKDKTGALISIERSQSLDEYTATGTKLNADVTAEMLTSIFVTTTPLHDGAVIIQGNKIACASAYFPPTNVDMPGRYGARHRAAVGISEITDALTIVVSEETGNISITESGRITRVDEKQLRKYLLRVLCGVQSSEETADPHWFDPGTDDMNQAADEADRQMDELEHHAEMIKLPQNHKHDRPKPSYPEQKKRIAPLSVTSDGKTIKEEKKDDTTSKPEGGEDDE